MSIHPSLLFDARHSSDVSTDTPSISRAGLLFPHGRIKTFRQVFFLYITLFENLRVEKHIGGVRLQFVWTGALLETVEGSSRLWNSKLSACLLGRNHKPALPPSMPHNRLMIYAGWPRPRKRGLRGVFFIAGRVIARARFALRQINWWLDHESLVRYHEAHIQSLVGYYTAPTYPWMP